MRKYYVFLNAPEGDVLPNPQSTPRYKENTELIIYKLAYALSFACVFRKSA